MVIQFLLIAIFFWDFFFFEEQKSKPLPMSKNPAVNPLDPLQFNPNAMGNKPAKIVFLLLFFF